LSTGKYLQPFSYVEMKERWKEKIGPRMTATCVMAEHGPLPWLARDLKKKPKGGGKE